MAHKRRKGRAQLSGRVADITASATLEVNDKVRQLLAKGRDIVNFGLGEADYPTPKVVEKGLHRVERAHFSRYTEAQGTRTLREAVCEAMRTNFHLDGGARRGGPRYAPEEVIVSAGSKHLIFSSIMALTEPRSRDEVLLISPYWVSYIDMVRLASARVRVLATDESTGFKPTPEAMERAVTKNTRLVILNTPNNPTGVCLTRKELQGLADVFLANDVTVVSDEIYGLLTYKERHTSLAALSEEMALRTIVTTGLSKAYSMGGWRIGFACVRDPNIHQGLLRVGANTISAPPSVTQDAVQEVFTAHRRVSQMRQDYAHRRDVMLKGMREAGLEFVEPDGTFYAFPSIKPYLGHRYKGKKLRGGLDFALHLLDEGVASVPGRAFGCRPNVRFAYVVRPERVEEGCARIGRFLSKLE